jgi:hypothetical protein
MAQKHTDPDPQRHLLFLGIQAFWSGFINGSNLDPDPEIIR